MDRTGSWEDLKERIDVFLLGLRHPILSEPGREILDLSTSYYSLSTEYNKLLWHVWNEQTNFVRQITGIRKEASGRMELQFQRFGKGPPGTLVLAESRAAVEQVERRTQRLRYAKTLERILGQLFPSWKVEGLSTAPDLKQTLSGRYARGLLRRGQGAWAFLGSGEEDPSAADEILTFGVLWLDRLRHSQPDKVIQGLKIFLPAQRAATTLQRLAGMNPRLAEWEVYETGEEVRRLDSSDVGNLKTSLAPLTPTHPPAFPDWAERIEGWSDAIESRCPAGGFRSWAVRGLPFARETSRGTVFGIGRSESALGEQSFAELQKLVEKLLLYRSPQSPDRQHPFFRLLPERWLQSALSRQMERLGCDLVAGTIYEQVPAVSGMERGVMDLLTLNARGRLVVIELKASEDPHLPLQALDYWMRVRRQQQQGEWERGRYFSGHPLSPEPPLLLLVSPALQFHPTCEILLRYFSPDIEAIRIGLNENWREDLQVVFRLPR